jgi:pSer/pThr/pTyr-binding forkhead associated (FHA) protein
MLVGGGKRSVLSGNRVLLGRSRDCDIRLDDPNVSRRHAELRRADSGWEIVDLGSTNGIKVNGRRRDRSPLEPGDRITLGLTDLTFELD